jgi:hypothetical protein
MVPIAFWMALRFVEEGEGKYLRRLLLACAYQVYLGIYIGYFLILSVVAFFLFLFLFRKRWNSVRDFFEKGGTRAVFRRGVDYAMSCFCFVLVMLPLAMPYCQTQLEIGPRTWDEVALMLPRWQSYLHAPASCWAGYPLAFVLGPLLSFLLTNRIRIGTDWSNEFMILLH